VTATDGTSFSREYTKRIYERTLKFFPEYHKWKKLPQLGRDLAPYDRTSAAAPYAAAALAAGGSIAQVTGAVEGDDTRRARELVETEPFVQELKDRDREKEAAVVPPTQQEIADKTIHDTLAEHWPEDAALSARADWSNADNPAGSLFSRESLSASAGGSLRASQQAVPPLKLEKIHTKSRKPVRPAAGK
jgi:hypothetical protein